MVYVNFCQANRWAHNYTTEFEFWTSFQVIQTDAGALFNVEASSHLTQFNSGWLGIRRRHEIQNSTPKRQAPGAWVWTFCIALNLHIFQSCQTLHWIIYNVCNVVVLRLLLLHTCAHAHLWPVSCWPSKTTVSSVHNRKV